jgi:hypothetical protein
MRKTVLTFGLIAGGILSVMMLATMPFKSPAAIDKQVADIQRFAELYENPAINVAITFIEPLPVGLIIALVSAGILRRRPQRRAAPDGVAVAM